MFVIYCYHKKQWRLVRKVWCACVLFLFSFWKCDLFINKYHWVLPSVGRGGSLKLNRWLVSTVCSECILFFFHLPHVREWMDAWSVGIVHSVCSVYNQLQYLNPPVCGEWFDPTVTHLPRTGCVVSVLSTLSLRCWHTGRSTHCAHTLYSTA